MCFDFSETSSACSPVHACVAIQASQGVTLDVDVRGLTNRHAQGANYGFGHLETCFAARESVGTSRTVSSVWNECVERMVETSGSARVLPFVIFTTYSHCWSVGMYIFIQRFTSSHLQNPCPNSAIPFCSWDTVKHVWLSTHTHTCFPAGTRFLCP